MDTPPMVVIKWQDVYSVESSPPFVYPDQLESEDLKPKTAYLIGFLVNETKDCYVVAKEWWETGQCKYLHVFPKKTAILEIWWLEPVQRDKGGRVKCEQPEGVK